MTVPAFFSPAIKTSFKIVAGLSVLLAAFSSSAALFMEDAITNAAPGGNLGSAAPWNGSSSQVKVAAGNLTLAGLLSPASPGNLANILGTSGSSSYRAFTGSPVSTGSVYYSFLIQSAGAPGASGYLTGLLPGGVTSPGGSGDALAVYFSASGSGYKLGIHKGSGPTTTNAAAVLATNTTQFIVVKYTFGPGTGDDSVSLYLNPVPGAAEPVAPDASQTGGTDVASLQNLYFKSSSGYGAWNFDTLRIGTTWADVTPADGPVPPASAPVITQTLLVPQGLVLRGSNGPASSVYQVLASTNIALPASNWPSIAAHTFDVGGNFDATNPVAPGLAQQYFRLLVGGTLPPAPTGPGITNQPQSLTVAVGANANFLVGAGGTAPLSYFWSFNTNTAVGGNSSTLALLNVQPGDAGSYRVIITNSIGAVTSSVATLTVLVPPAITADPTNLTVVSGGSAVFNVSATGSAPLRYQWYFNDTDTPLDNATNATLTLNPVNATNAGTYSVIVSNAVGSVTSAVAVLTVFGPPVISAQPQNLAVTVSNDATFTVTAAGTAPLAYQWFFNTNTPVGVNSNGFTRLNAQTNDAGTYSVIVTNNHGAVTSALATLTVSASILNNSLFNLTGFAQTTTGGGQIPETDPAYAKVTNALQFANAIDNDNIKVIEIMADLDLGWLEIGAAAQAVGPFRSQQNTPLLHPRLLQTGVSLLDIQSKNGLTIFSANGATIRHCCFNIKNARNIIIRNLKFDEMWEWDESTKGDYDRNDWDFIDLGNGGGTGTTTNIWVDHCTFTKAYDGICDIKGGANHITFSWNKYVGDDGDVNTNSFVWQQINALEANRNSYAFYNFLRNNGFSTTNIVTILHGHDKTHLIGATSGVGSPGNAAENALLSATFHHQWYQNPWDRLPRLRGGNVHNYNIFADDSAGLDAKRMRDNIAAAMSPANQTTLNSTYNFQIFLNGSISTENGAILVENSIYQDCLTPLRNNQTDVNNPAYTGKIMALNSIYSFRTTGGTTNNYTGSSTNAPGDTYFGPVQAPAISFSWNLPGGVLPYSYSMTDPNQLKSVLTNATSGCGSGVLTWAKTNWLKTAY